MKKPQRNFVVELKSRRRQQAATPRSIWGNLDLKTVTDSVAKEKTPFPASSRISADISCKSPNVEANPLLTRSSRMPESNVSQQERAMADETTEGVNTENLNAEAATTVTEPKKQRAARSPKPATIAAAADEAAAGEPATAAAGKPRKQRRLSKGKSATTEAKPAKKAPTPRASAAPAAAGVAPVTAADEMADLLQLEEENRALRKQLAEKLRAENADLRKRLGVS
ncbi:transcriptional regulator [Rhizobium sp. SYY.PMSO]|uniref:transcriptional regulator n=1 Tax=Rhizobium sp. SYY.PMSO TaxID=3382192 RepID=UPI00398FD154